MDAERFDALTKSLSSALNRRRMLASLLGSVVATALRRHTAAQSQPCDPRLPLNSPGNCPPCHFCGAVSPPPNGVCVPSVGLPCGTGPSSQCVHCQFRSTAPPPGFVCVTDSGACLIDEECFAADDLNPDNPCQVCDPGRSQTDWSNVADETPCADDGNPCTEDICVNGQCTHPAASGSGCLIAGECVSEGTANPQNSCQVCDPVNDPSDWSNADGEPCDDGDACTQTDICQGGQCVGSNPIVCEALDQCHLVGACDPDTGTCTDPEADDGTPCGDGDVCTEASACRAGVCVGEAKTCPGATECCRRPGNHLGQCVAKQACAKSK